VKENHAIEYKYLKIPAIPKYKNYKALGERFRADLTGQIRFRTISGFSNYLIFYRQVDTVLEIIRVLHGARDYEDLFD